jgi:2-polyprenyl-6-hydroxyphenyl methylase / 3-demethylubiquinone-9 3-methyltransferase
MAGTIDREEIARFSRESAGWWSTEGAFAPLHRANPPRLRYIRERLLSQFRREPQSLAPFQGLTLLDVGCGGGLVAEPMARLGFRVTGIDADAAALGIARSHSEESGLAIAYREAAVETLAAEGQAFDVVLALEVAEHAQDRALFFEALARLVKPGGALIVATLNRTAKSFVLAIIGAEYLLGWLPRGTHRWEKFMRPSEVAAHLRPQGVKPVDVTGLVYAPWRGGWTTAPDTGVNYFLFAIRPK